MAHLGLLGNESRRLVSHHSIARGGGGTTLRVSQNDPIDAKVLQLVSRYLSSEGTIASEMTVLCSDLDLGADGGEDSCEVEHRGCYDDINLVVKVWVSSHRLIDPSDQLGKRLKIAVALPVPTDHHLPLAVSRGVVGIDPMLNKAAFVGATDCHVEGGQSGVDREVPLDASRAAWHNE